MKFFYDVVCPYAYMAFTQLPALREKTGEGFALRPALLGGLLRSVGGPDDPNAVMSPAKKTMVRRDIRRSADLLGVPLTIPEAHPQRTVDAMRLVVAAGQEKRAAISADLYRAYWVDGADVTRHEVLDAVARRHGLEEGEFRSDAARQGLFDATAAASEAGAFGVPTFVGARDLVWGQDRMGLLRRFLGEDLDLSVSEREGRSVAGSRVVVYHDIASPFSYLAAGQIARVAARHGAAVEWKPILLGALFREIGTADVPLFEMHARKQAWVRRDLEHWAEAWGMPYRFPAHFPIRSVLPLRLMLAEPALTPILYRAAWADDRRVDEPDAVEEILTEAGMSAADVLARASSPEIKAALRANTAEALASGVCGVPTFDVQRPGRDGLLLWGQDRLVMVDAALRGWTPPAG